MKIVVVMPAYNEAEGIVEFLRELNESLCDYQASFVVVDDFSQDATKEVIDRLSGDGFPAVCLRNDVNAGHGVSTLRALRSGLETDAQVVVAIDGDGQFIGNDVRRVVDTLTSDSRLDVVEGVRTSRNDPFYRQATSSVTRLLVWSRCRRWPSDANTPLRAYRPEVLASLLEVVPDDSSTPNLIFSAMSRRWHLRLAEVRVASIPRRGSVSSGSTWGSGSLNLPTKRFIKFCGRASVEWFTTPMRHRNQ